MNAATHRIVSTLLALVSIFGLLAGAFGIRDALAVKDYMTAGEGDPVAQLTDGISQLKENETAYNDGIVQYKDGLIQLDDGAAQLADGEVQLADGKRQLADGEKQLAQGYRDYAAGQKQLADGQRQIDENTAAYKEGKATLAKIEPIIPYLNKYIAFRDGTIAKLDGFSDAQAWFMSIVRPLMKQLGLFDIPDDVTDLPVYITTMVKDGKAQLKQYEDGLKQLADGKRQLAEGKKQLEDGERQLADGRRQVAQGEKDLAKGYEDYADGEQQLKDGRAQLKLFEDGMVQLADGLNEVLSQKSYAYKNGTVVVSSPADKLGKDFDFYKKTKDGVDIKMLNGESYVDLDQATKTRDVLATYVDDMTGAVTKEIVSRLATSALLILGSLAGLIAAIRGLTKTKGFVPGVIAAVLGLVALIGGIATKFTDRVFLLEDGGATGGLQVAGIVLFTILACLFAAVTYFTRDKTKKVKVEDIEA
ncbi:MAG: hypothetical protein J5847_06095 [Clostridia bacterium]|nr:hypothetical protein [Clostridia bacterium]MBR5753979.1 hypothetical protein [Clostridia bacterium]